MEYKSKYPDEVVWMDNVNGGWFQQNLLLHALRTRSVEYRGYLVVTDDSVLRFPDMVNMPKDAFWSPALSRRGEYPKNATECPQGHYMCPRLVRFAKKISNASRVNLKNNLGGQLPKAVRVQPDFFYLPARYEVEWTALAEQMNGYY